MQPLIRLVFFTMCLDSYLIWPFISSSSLSVLQPFSSVAVLSHRSLSSLLQPSGPWTSLSNSHACTLPSSFAVQVCVACFISSRWTSQCNLVAKPFVCSSTSAGCAVHFLLLLRCHTPSAYLQAGVASATIEGHALESSGSDVSNRWP